MGRESKDETYTFDEVEILFYNWQHLKIQEELDRLSDVKIDPLKTTTIEEFLDSIRK